MDIEQKGEEELESFERKILRRMYGGKEEGGVSKRPTNKELMKL